jgi:hypothetical protein
VPCSFPGAARARTDWREGVLPYAMAKPKTPPLVIALCRALVAAVGHKPPPYWTSIDPIRDALGVPIDKLNAAVEWAKAHHLVDVSGKPAHSLTVTHEGIMLSTTVRKPKTAKAVKKPRPSRGK